jgi:CheR methyltransferase, all-alpha domain
MPADSRAVAVALDAGPAGSAPSGALAPAPRADEPASGRVSPARSQHQPAKTGVSALMSSDALCARTSEESPRWPLAPLASAAREFDFSDTDFRSLVQIARQHTGIALSDGKRDLVYGRLSRRLRALGFSAFRQ